MSRDCSSKGVSGGHSTPASLMMAIANPHHSVSCRNLTPRGTRPTLPPLPANPGAVAVVGPSGAELQEDDDYTLTGPTENSGQSKPMAPVAARLVHGSEEDVEALQEEIDRMRRERENLVVGQVVLRDESQDVADTGNQKFGRKIWLLVGLLLLVLVGVVAVVIAVSTKLPAPPAAVGAEEPPTQATISPAPTSTPLSLFDLLSSISFDGGSALRTPSTPQNNAYNWLENSANITSFSDGKRIQRYVLATLYFSTNGDSWASNTGWLSNDDECDWYTDVGDFCSNGAVVDLDLRWNNLVGSLPVEIALLSSSLSMYIQSL